MTLPVPRRSWTKGRASPAARAGDALRRLVDLVSHGSGLAVGLMNETGVSLPQVLLMNHVARRGACSPSELAEAMHVTPPAVSQMTERLVQQGLLERRDDPADRRRRSVTTTAAARSFLRELGAARAAEYERGLVGVAPERLAPMIAALERVVAALDVNPSSCGDVGARKAGQR